MRDGVHLSTDVVLPQGVSRKLGTVLVRTPYGRDGEWAFWVKPFFEAYLKQDFAVVLQDERGRYFSEGSFKNYLQGASTDGSRAAGALALPDVGAAPFRLAAPAGASGAFLRPNVAKAAAPSKTTAPVASSANTTALLRFGRACCELAKLSWANEGIERAIRRSDFNLQLIDCDGSARDERGRRVRAENRQRHRAKDSIRGPIDVR